MSEATFRALLVEEIDGSPQARLTTLTESNLPAGDVLVNVIYSSLNYKDGMAVTGTGKILRSFPIVPGIDLAGTVISSQATEFSPGDSVVVTGYGVGERYWGGYAQRARLQAGWVVPLPSGMSMRQAMAIGTAGLTAMLSVIALEKHGCEPDSGEILVTGASGGVGSVAVALLANLGYTVVASTGRQALHDYLRDLGASDVISRDDLTREHRPLEKGRWCGAVDAVGGQTLATLLATMAPGGSVASVGLAGGADLHTTVYPFILRGVNLLGIDSVNAPQTLRREAWARLAHDLPVDQLETMTHEATLDEIFDLSQQIIDGEIRGRTVIRLGD